VKRRASVLVLGLGNALLSDDGVGVHAVRRLEASYAPAPSGVACRDGGTIGLALLGEIEDADSLIIVDAARFGGSPGAIELFEQERFDARIRSGRQSAHDLALSELIDAARLTGGLPERRALLGVEPASVAWGLEPTPAVAAALPKVVEILRDWVAARRAAPEKEPA
jgi:hydrogenase maturation protease